MASNKESNKPSFTSRIASTITNSPILRRWAAGKASPKPPPSNPRGNNNYSFQGFKTRDPIKPFDRHEKHHFEKLPERRESYHRAEGKSETSSASSSKAPFVDTSTVAPANPSPPPKTFVEKVWKFARNAGPRLLKMNEGLKEALFGGMSSIKNPQVRRQMESFALSMGLVLLVMYVGLMSLTLVYAPLFLFTWFWLPGLFMQIAALLPLWSYNITRKRYPSLSNKLFLDELEVLCSPRAKELQQLITHDSGLNSTWLDELYHDLRTSWHFTRFSLICSTFSIIPVFGPFISYLGQLWIVSDKMGWNLLSVYTISAKKMSYRQQKHWMRARKWRIIGFTIPYCLIASIPVVGPLVIIVAQSAIAHLYFHLLSKEAENIVGDKKPNNSAPEAEKRAV
jgi:hypothetical protein